MFQLSTSAVIRVAVLTAVMLCSSLQADSASFRKRLLKFSEPRLLQKPPILFDVDEQSKIIKEKQKVTPRPPETKLVPDRVYLVYLEKDKIWVYVRTDFEGYLPNPIEGYRALSIIPGRYLGADDPGQNYQLSREGVWVKTFQSEQHFLWVYGDPPKLKVINVSILKPQTDEKDKK